MRSIMPYLKCLGFIFILLWITTPVFAQIEQPKSIRIDQDSSANKSESNTPDLSVLKNPSINNDSDELVDISVKKPRTVKMLPEYEYGHRGKEMEKEANERLKKSLGTDQQLFGEIKTRSGSVNLIFRDNGSFVDGDKVEVYHNDKLIYKNITLTGKYEAFIIHLENGINKIDIKAINEGYSSPNTAEFHVIDEDGKSISSSSWALYTGGVGTMFVIK